MNLYNPLEAITLTSKSLFIIPLLAFVLASPAGAQLPELHPDCRSKNYYAPLPDTTYGAMRSPDSCRLLIEENMVKEMYPLLTYLFFDSASAAIPDRYILFTDPAQTAGFTDTTIPGGTLGKYYHLLNIIGYRMRINPDTRVEIAGKSCNGVTRYSKVAMTGETKKIAEQRGSVVYEYLVNIWKIDPARLRLLPPADLSGELSHGYDPLSMIENYRAEIFSRDWEIMKPVVSTDFRRYMEPETIKFRMNNGIDDKLVKNRVIEIRRNGRLWHVMDDIGLESNITEPPYNWGHGGRIDSIPDDEMPYRVQLVVYAADGTEHRSREIELPVVILTSEEKIRENLIDKKIERYTLPFYKVGKPMLDDLQERILREYVYGSIRRGAHIKIIGHTDVIGREEVNRKISALQAEAVGKRIERDVQGIASIETTGVGEDDLLYTNQWPEGRFNSRAVQIIVVNPAGEREERR